MSRKPISEVQMSLIHARTFGYAARYGGDRLHWLSPRLWLLGCFPSAARTQAAVAEMLSQAIAAKLSLPEAIAVAAEMTRGFPVGDLLSHTAEMVRLGEEVPASLRWAGMHLHLDLVAAFDVAESRGNLGDELAAAARRLDAHVADHVAAAIGRRPTARRFATSLARLLAQAPLTFQLVHDAARLVGTRDRQFRCVIRWLALDIEGGCPFAEALARFPQVFDPLFVRCVGNAQSREQMRAVLARLGGGS
jgi:type II secretory pathway component PulF